MGIIERISQFVPKENILEKELMSRHTTFKVGGPCFILVKIDEVSQLKELLPYLVEEKIPYFLLRGRSNRPCAWPNHRYTTDKMYNWTWDNLKLLFQGAR